LQIRMARQGFHDVDDVGMFEEDQTTIAVVVRKSTERLGTNGDLGMQFETGIEGDAHEPGSGSVDAAHPIDRNLLDQHLGFDCRRRSGLRGGVVGFGFDLSVENRGVCGRSAHVRSVPRPERRPSTVRISNRSAVGVVRDSRG